MSINGNNAAVVARLVRAQECIAELGRLDPTVCVVGVDVCTPHPVITVDHAPRSVTTRGALKSRTWGRFGSERTLVAVVRDCQVQWSEAGACRGAA